MVPEVSTRGFDQEVADDRPEERRRDADDPDPVGPQQDPFFRSRTRGRSTRQGDAADHPRRAVRDAVEHDAAVRRGLRSELSPVVGDEGHRHEREVERHIQSRAHKFRPDLGRAVHVVDRERMVHCVVVVERHDQSDRDLGNQNQVPRKLLLGPNRLTEHGHAERGQRSRLRRDSRDEKREDGDSEQTRHHDEREASHPTTFWLPLPSGDLRTSAKMNVSYLYVVQLCIFLPRNWVNSSHCTGLTNAHRVAYPRIYKRIHMKMNRVSDHPANRRRNDSTKTF